MNITHKEGPFVRMAVITVNVPTVSITIEITVRQSKCPATHAWEVPSINWPSIGSTTPAIAEAFGVALIQSSAIANEMANRTIQEAAEAFAAKQNKE